MAYKVSKACKVLRVTKGFQGLKVQMDVHSILTLPTLIMQQVVDSVKQTLTKPLLGCTLTLIQQIAEILLTIAGRDGKVMMAPMGYQVNQEQMEERLMFTLLILIMRMVLV